MDSSVDPFDIEAGTEGLEEPTDPSRRSPIEPCLEGLTEPSPFPSLSKVPLGMRMLWKRVVSKSFRRPSQLSPKKRKVEVAPKELHRSDRICQGLTSSSARSKMPKII